LRVPGRGNTFEFPFPVFLVPLADALGGRRGAAAAAFSVHNVAVGVVATVVGPLMGRLGQRAVLAAGAVILGAGLAASGSARSPLWLLVWFGLIAGTGAGLLGSVAQTVMLSRWFPTARGAVTGFALSGMGIGIFLFAPVSALLIDRFGWRGAFLALGAGTAVLLLPVNALVPTTPSEPAPVSGVAARGGAEPRLVTIVPTLRFWCFALASFFTPVSNMMVTTHQVAHIVGSGVDPRLAASAFGLVGLLSGLGRTSFGALSDRWGRVPTALTSYAVTAAGTLALALIAPGAPGWLLWAFVLPFGLSLGARAPIVAALAGDVYRGRAYGPVLGLITFGNRLGSAVGPWLGGVIYDLTGNYRAAFAGAIAALAIAALAFVGAGWKRPAAGRGPSGV